MPYIYAIEEKIYEDGIPPMDGAFKPFKSKYHPVTKEVAETNVDGCWKLVGVHGRSFSGWQQFDSVAEAALNYGKGKPLADAMGETLAAGDFVMTTVDKYADLRLCEVVSFTPQKIRIRDLKKGYKLILKFPEDIVKVDSRLIN